MTENETPRSFGEMRREIAQRVGTVLEQFLEETSLQEGIQSALQENLRLMKSTDDPERHREIHRSFAEALTCLLSRQKKQRENHFRLLKDSLLGSLQTIFSLERTTADLSVLTFQIRLLERFLITSEVIQDWEGHIKALLADISSVIEIFFLFSVFRQEGTAYSIKIFWMATPAEASKILLERLVREHLQKIDQSDPSKKLAIAHTIVNPAETLPPLSEETLSLFTKSLLFEPPRIQGVAGIGVNARTIHHPVKILVIESILTSILNIVGSVEAIDKYTKDLEYYSVRDPLTDLFNQRIFWELLANEACRSERQNQSFSLLVIDIDDFKKINDTFGHIFGDAFLQSVAFILKETARKEDVLARYGGDEFALILPRTGPEQAAALAGRILDRIRSFTLKSEQGKIAKTSLSIGIASHPLHSREPKDLFLIADSMMYRGKTYGKNQYQLPANEDVAQVFRSLSEKYILLQQAISDRSILPYFQPIALSSDGTIAGYEVLMRLMVKDRPLPAEEFINVAEESGLISHLDCIVIEKAFKKIVSKGFAGYLFVNISPKSIVSSEFIPTIRSLLRTTGINPKQVVFEITERETLKNAGLLEQFVKELKREGSLFAIDDFGSGFSSLTYLKLFSVDFLKVEGEFIRSLSAPQGIDRAIVASICTLANETGIRTVAESVESKEILDNVRKYNLTYVQGYHIGAPMSDLVEG